MKIGDSQSNCLLWPMCITEPVGGLINIYHGYGCYKGHGLMIVLCAWNQRELPEITHSSFCKSIEPKSNWLKFDFYWSYLPYILMTLPLPIIILWNKVCFFSTNYSSLSISDNNFILTISACQLLPKSVLCLDMLKVCTIYHFPNQISISPHGYLKN